MIRSVVFLSLAISTSVWSDLTINSTSTPGVNGETDRQTIYLKDDQMRIDQISKELRNGQQVDVVNTSILIRFSGEPAGMIFLDHKNRTARQTSTLEAISDEQTVNAKTEPPDAPPSVVKRNETRDIMGKTAQGYDFSYSGSVDSMSMGGQQIPPEVASMMKMRLHVTGTAWVVPGMEGADELAAFYARMAEHQMTISVGNSNGSESGASQSAAAPGLPRGVTDAMAQVSARGFPLLTRMTSEVKIEMEGPMAGMMQGMMQAPGGGFTNESEVTSVQTGVLDAALFYNGGLPEGYTLISGSHGGG